MAYHKMDGNRALRMALQTRNNILKEKKQLKHLYCAVLLSLLWQECVEATISERITVHRR
jgi:hypothetical protein